MIFHRENRTQEEMKVDRIAALERTASYRAHLTQNQLEEDRIAALQRMVSHRRNRTGAKYDIPNKNRTLVW